MTKSNLQKCWKAEFLRLQANLALQKARNGKKLSIMPKSSRVMDAVNLTDNQTAMCGLPVLPAAKLFWIWSGAKYTDNLPRLQPIGIQSDVLGAVALGIKNILCIQGDHASFGNETQAKNVNDLDSINLISTLKKMRDEQELLGGDKLEAPIDIFIGAVANPFADPFEYRAYRLAKKVAAGADFIQTQAIYDMERFERWMEKVRELGLHKKVPILAGIIPLKSVGAARYMQKNVAGMIVPDHIIDRLKAAEDKKAEGVNIAVEMIKHLQTIEGVAGVHIMAVAWEEIVPEIVKRAGLYPRPKFD